MAQSTTCRLQATLSTRRWLSSTLLHPLAVPKTTRAPHYQFVVVKRFVRTAAVYHHLLEKLIAVGRNDGQDRRRLVGEYSVAGGAATTVMRCINATRRGSRTSRSVKSLMPSPKPVPPISAEATV